MRRLLPTTLLLAAALTWHATGATLGSRAAYVQALRRRSGQVTGTAEVRSGQVNSTAEVSSHHLCNLDPSCLTNSPRLVKVQHSPASQAVSYYYQVPRRLKIIRRKKIVRTYTPPLTTGADQPDQTGYHPLFDHIQLTSQYGMRLKARNSSAGSSTDPPQPWGNTDPPQPPTTPQPLLIIQPPSNAIDDAADATLQLLHSVHDLRETPPARPRSRAQMRHQALARERAREMSGDTARAFRVNTLKQRRRIMAKKLTARKKKMKKKKKLHAVKKVHVLRPPARNSSAVSGTPSESVDSNSVVNEYKEYPSDAPAPGIKGFPGVDYPIYHHLPETEFQCKDQRYWGMFADMEAHCQVWHYCDQDGNKHSFLCPNGTLFSQVTFICDWWFNVDCHQSVQQYVTNEALSLLPAPPQKTFPEDFNGPIVDWYIYQRHQEKAYRKEKFLRQLEEGITQKSIKFLETHDFPPWFTPKDIKLYLKLKAIERQSKAEPEGNRLGEGEGEGEDAPQTRSIRKKELKPYGAW